MTKRAGKLSWTRTSFKQNVTPAGKTPGVPQDHQSKKTVDVNYVTVGQDQAVAEKVKVITRKLVQVMQVAAATNGVAAGFVVGFVVLGAASLPWLLGAAFAVWMTFSFHVAGQQIASGEALADDIKRLAITSVGLDRARGK